MSWTLSIDLSAEEIVDGGLDEIKESPASDAPEQAEQVEAGKAAVLALVQAGVVGSQRVIGSIAGHATPDNEIVLGGNPSISVAVSSRAN